VSRTGEQTPLIIGGRPSVKGRWPWVVSLSRWRPEEEVFRHTCGGSLLTPTIVLTAAHCVDASNDPDDYEVYVGAYDQINRDQEQTIKVKSFEQHEDYDRFGEGIPNDIALVELDEPADIDNEYIGLAPLPRSSDEMAGNPDCWIAGWGRLNPHPDNWTASPVQLEVNTAVHTLDDCRDIWREFLNGSEPAILDQHVCVGLPDRGGCHGDSGSPAQCDATGNGDWVIIGLNSWGTGNRCAAATNAFVRVTWFLDWIRERVPGLPGSKPEQPEWEGPEPCC
jgi:secreted trypsin-like serine protease